MPIDLLKLMRYNIKKQLLLISSACFFMACSGSLSYTTEEKWKVENFSIRVERDLNEKEGLYYKRGKLYTGRNYLLNEENQVVEKQSFKKGMKDGVWKYYPFPHHNHYQYDRQEWKDGVLVKSTSGYPLDHLFQDGDIEENDNN